MAPKQKQSPKSSRRPEAVPAATLDLRVQPRASRNGITLQPDGTCKVRLTAPPVDGAANEALVRFLAEAFSVGRSEVEIVSGHTGRQKIVRITGISDADVAQVLKARDK
jgi:uncharacterized protein (TIGR00251 family)